jgi:hypothetical protein
MKANGLLDIREQEKLEYLSRSFKLLKQEGKDYIENLSRQLLYIQYPNVRPGRSLKKSARQTREM